MPTFTRKTFASYYKNLFGINQSSNSGVDSTTREVQDGAGKNTSIALSDDVLQVKPQTDNTTGTFIVKNASGSTIFSVDTVNNQVLAGSTQLPVNQHYMYFSATRITPVADTHMLIPLLTSNPFGSGSDHLVEQNLGSGADPTTSLDLSAQDDSVYLSPYYWYVPDAIKIVAVNVVVGGSQSSGDTLGFHLMKYTLDISSNFGDLSSGVVVADGGTMNDANEDKILVSSLSINSSNSSVSSGKVLLLTVESDSTDDISVNATIKYNIT